MNLDSDFAPGYEEQIPVAYKPRRRLRVRHSYPESVIELARHLRFLVPTREIAAALDIPLSSVYRWAPIESFATTVSVGKSIDEWKPLLARCKADGFVVSEAVVENLLCHSRKASRTRTHPGKQRAPLHNAAERPELATTRLLIERDYFRPIDSFSLANAAGLSRFRFIHAFTETYGISPHQYLLRTRLEAAKKLLAKSRETIDVVAAATGFRSGACLNRAFTRVEGRCISQFSRVIDDHD